MNVSKSKITKCLLKILMSAGFLVTGIPILLGLIFLIHVWLCGQSHRMPRSHIMKTQMLYTSVEKVGDRVKVIFSHDSVHFGNSSVEFDHTAAQDICFYYVAPDTVYVEEPAWAKCVVSGGEYAIIRIGYWPFTLYPRSSKPYTEYLGEKFLKEKYIICRDSVFLRDKQYAKIPAYTILNF